jgi:murein DD-endopeptidase MepM/ murein hydrolase activator NlpD
VLERVPVGIALVLVLLSTASASASGWQARDEGGATARAYGIKIVVPGQAGASTPTLATPPNAVQFSGAFSYGNGVVTAGSASVSVTAAPGTEATASGSAEVDAVSIFGGQVTAASVLAQAHATARPAAASGDDSGSAVTGLVALGQPVAAGTTVPLADWGTLQTIEAASTNAAATGYHGFVTGIDVRLTADHDGLPAGTSITIGYAEATAKAAPPAPPTEPPGPVGKAKPGNGKPPAAHAPGLFPPTSQPLKITPRLRTPGGHVFPVYGPSSFIDSYGAGRSDVSGGWHHGDDIFAPLGAPVIAVSSGTVFSVGWNEVGGNRLWLRDGAGNEYYYAHLSAYTPLARNGVIVNAGEVLGFVGNTGDAQGTPYHLHFEVHPVQLLGLGYDGAVDPTGYLTAWKHLQDVSFSGGSAWAPLGHSANAPKPGAILISASDISSADGLDPGSLERIVHPLGLLPRAVAVAAHPRRKPAAGDRAAAGRVSSP